MKVVQVAAAVVCFAVAVLAGTDGDLTKPKPAPRLPDNQWLNTPRNEPLRIEELRGKVVLVEFWTFACYNCRNVLPYLKSWHRKYADQGLVVIGVHTPEFPSEREPRHVEKAIRELGIEFPVALDNDYATWNRYNNQYWPAFCLIDLEGRIVYTAVGEGNYDRTERKIQQLLDLARIQQGHAEGKSKAVPPQK